MFRLQDYVSISLDSRSFDHIIVIDKNQFYSGDVKFVHRKVEYSLEDAVTEGLDDGEPYDIIPGETKFVSYYASVRRTQPSVSLDSMTKDYVPFIGADYLVKSGGLERHINNLGFLKDGKFLNPIKIKEFLDYTLETVKNNKMLASLYEWDRFGRLQNVGFKTYKSGGETKIVNGLQRTLFMVFDQDSSGNVIKMTATTRKITDLDSHKWAEIDYNGQKTLNVWPSKYWVIDDENAVDISKKYRFDTTKYNSEIDPTYTNVYDDVAKKDKYPNSVIFIILTESLSIFETKGIYLFITRYLYPPSSTTLSCIVSRSI